LKLTCLSSWTIFGIDGEPVCQKQDTENKNGGYGQDAPSPV